MILWEVVFLKDKNWFAQKAIFQKKTNFCTTRLLAQEKPTKYEEEELRWEIRASSSDRAIDIAQRFYADRESEEYEVIEKSVSDVYPY